MTKPASGEARKTTPAATSAGSPQRRIGVRARIGVVAGGVGAQRRGERRRDPARGDGVHADAVGGVGDGEGLGHLGDAALRRGIAGDEAAAEEGENRGGVDDRAAGLGEARARGGAGPHRAGEVDVDDLGEDRRVELGAAADDAGAVDEQVEARQRGDQRPRRRRRRGRRGGRRRPPGQPRAAAATSASVAPVASDRGAEAGEGPRDGEADAGGAAGDEACRPAKRSGRRAARASADELVDIVGSEARRGRNARGRGRSW